MSRSEIILVINKILSNKFSVPEEVLVPDNLSEPLVGKIYKIDAIIMTYLYYELQKAFKIQFDSNHVIDYQFMSIEGIASVIENIFNVIK